ncbi:hypothetical protein MRX96_030052 [Rhipicephalus microplus]
MSVGAKKRVIPNATTLCLSTRRSLAGFKPKLATIGARDSRPRLHSDSDGDAVICAREKGPAGAAARLTSAHGFGGGETRSRQEPRCQEWWLPRRHRWGTGPPWTRVSGGQAAVSRTVAQSRSATWTSTLLRCLTSCCATRSRGIVGRRATLGTPWGWLGGDSRSPRRHTSGGHRGGVDHEQLSSAAPAMGDPGPDSDIFEGHARRAVSPLRERAPAQTERRDRWKCVRDGMRALSSPGPDHDAPGARSWRLFWGAAPSGCTKKKH